MSPAKPNQSMNDDLRLGGCSKGPDGNNYNKLKEAIRTNEANIKLYVKE
jgi:hypothetical protein